MSLFSKLKTLVKIQKVFKPSPLILATNLILCVFHYWLVILKGRYDGIFVDTILRNSSHEKLKIIIFCIILYYIAYKALEKLRDMMNNQFSQHIINQIKKKITKPPTNDFIDLCENSISLLVAPVYDIIRIIIIAYIMYSISQYLSLLVLCLTPFKILGIFSSQFFKKEESEEELWKLEFCKGLLDKILQVIVIYCVGVRFIDNEISIEDLVILGSQLITFDRLLPAVKTDFEGLGKALLLFERVFEEIETGAQSEQEQFGEKAFEVKRRTTHIQWKLWNYRVKILKKNVKKMRKVFFQTIRKIKTLTWNLLNLRLRQENSEQGRQEQGLSLDTEKGFSVQRKKRPSVVKSVKEKVESWIGRKELRYNEEGSPRKRERIIRNA